MCECSINAPIGSARWLKENARRELALSIADNGAWEEFHQRQGNWTMRDHHKARRLKLESEYRRLYGKD